MNLAIITGKLVGLGLRISGRRGSALPGLVAERLFPNSLSEGLSKLPSGVVMVTGTNGKTSTTKILAEMFIANGVKVLTDSTGSNMTRGLLSLVIKKSSWSGKLPYDIAILEVDEAYSAVLSRSLKPKALLVLNIHRDQMDRYGEIDKTAAMIAETASNTTDIVMLSGIDRQMQPIATAVKSASIEYFSCSDDLKSEFPDDEELYSNEESNKLLFVQAGYTLVSSQVGVCEIAANGKKYSFKPLVPGGYNHLNIPAAFGLFSELTSPNDDEVTKAIKAVNQLEPAFGRGESVKVNGNDVRILLVKNPGGFKQALKLLSTDYKHVDILINDGYADGRDVSWLWDVDFSHIKSSGYDVSVGGTRSYDMALRLKHDDVESSVYDSVSDLVDACQTGQDKRIIFATYTAMLELRTELSKVVSMEKVL